MVSIRDRNLSREETHLTVLEILPGEFREIKADAETWLQNGLEYRASFSFPEDGEYGFLQKAQIWREIICRSLWSAQRSIRQLQSFR